MVLIVDDNDDSRRALAMLLQLEGFDTAEAPSGREALQLLHTRLPHCVILDYNMPGMTGLDVLRHIRSDPRMAQVRVILFSAASSEIESLAIEAGADAFVQKCSLDFGELLRQLTTHCQPTAAPRPLKVPEELRKHEAG